MLYLVTARGFVSFVGFVTGTPFSDGKAGSLHFFMKRKKENIEKYLISRVVVFILFQDLLHLFALAVAHGCGCDVPPTPREFFKELV